MGLFGGLPGALSAPTPNRKEAMAREFAELCPKCKTSVADIMDYVKTGKVDLAAEPSFYLEELEHATEQRKQSQEEWEEALREAARHHSLRAVAPAAGVTYGRVAQIVGPKTTEPRGL